MSTNSHLTHRTPKPRPITKLTASAIALSVLLSPLELPLSRLASQPEDFFVANTHTAKESYDDTQEEAIRPVTKNDKVTFTRGEGVPDYSDAIVGVRAASPSLLAELAPEEKLELEQEPTIARLVRNTKRGENVIAALAIANGDTKSELTSVDLDIDGNITQTTDLHGATKKAEYDEAGRPVRIINADGSESYYSYNQKGQLTSVSHTSPELARGPVMTVLAAIANPLFALADDEDNASFFYDADNIAAVQDSAGAIAYEYDEDGLLSSETYPDGSGVEYSYDDLGNLVSSEEFESSDTKLSLGSFLRMSYASPVNSYFTEESTYNDNNQLAQYTVAEVADLPAPAAEATVSDVTVATTSPITIEIVSSTTAPVVSEAATEATSSLESVIPIVPAVIEETVLEVTEAITAYFSSASSAFALWLDNSLNRAWAGVTEVAEVITAPTVVSTSTPLYGISFSYDTQGNVIESRTTAGVITTYTYDAKTDALIEKVVTTAQGVVDRQTYQVDVQARITGSDGTAYEFSEGGMLTVAGVNQYNYDEYGNRSVQTGADGATFTYSGNRLLQTTYDSGRVTSYAYDERGAVSTVTDSVEGVTEFTYTPSGAVESISQNGVSVTYTYDALGRRVSRTSSTEGAWTYEFNGTLLKRVVAPGEVILREYFYTPAGDLTAVRADGALYHVVTSGNKSITGLVNVTTGELFKQTYDAWGAVVSSNFPIKLDVGYIGTFAETGFGVSVFGPRVYDPELGRFLSKDPLPGVLIDGLSQNEYIYAKNDPINQYDPSGHASEIAQKSDSPKRALVETEAALELLRNDEAQAKATYSTLLNTPEAEVVDLATHQEEIVRAQNALEASEAAVVSLEVLYSLQIQSIEENENDAAAAEMIDSQAVAQTEGTLVASLTEGTITSNTIATEAGSTSTVEAVTFSLPVLEAVAEPEPIASTTEVSTTMFGSVLAVASVVFSDHVLKAEAKKAKSKIKKPKLKSTGKAKSKQKREAKKAAKQLTQLKDLERKLLAMKVIVDKRVEVERQAKQKTENAVQNIKALNASQIADLSKAPKSPTMNTGPGPGTCGANMSCPSAGIVSPAATYAPSQTSAVKEFFTTQNAHYALTACGFEQTVVGAVCGVTDGLLYALKGDWLGAGLSAGSAIPFIGMTADGTKAAKLALVAFRTEIATKIAAGHALTKHLSEFQNLGIINREQFLKHAQNVISSPTYSKKLERGREVYFDQKTNTILIHDPSNVDLGTMFRQNIDYYNNLK
jgi:RHS repeat-associated protein